MGWFWFAIAMAALLTFAALVKEGTVKLPNLPLTSASDTTPTDLPADAGATSEPELTTTAEVTLTTAQVNDTNADTTASAEPTLTTAAAQENEAIDTTAVRTVILDNYAMKYHLDENCAAAQMIAGENKETAEKSIDEVEGLGYLPCDMCANRG